MALTDDEHYALWRDIAALLEDIQNSDAWVTSRRIHDQQQLQSLGIIALAEAIERRG